MTSTIEAAGAKSDQLAQEIAEVEQEIADDQAALDQATSLRQKALDEFTTEERDLLQSIQSLKDAIAVLSKHHRAPEEELLSIAALVPAAAEIDPRGILSIGNFEANLFGRFPPPIRQHS